MRRAFALVLLGSLVLLGILREPAESKQPPPPATALRYPDVHPVFAKHCAACHDARRSENTAAQAVFEMTSYPFSTTRPTTLLGDLRHMFEVRKSLSADEKWRGLSWLSAGALDADGKPPRWRAPRDQRH